MSKINHWNLQKAIFENQSLKLWCQFFIFWKSSIIECFIFSFFIFHFWSHFSFLYFSFFIFLLHPLAVARHLRESEFPCTSKEIQNCWHSIRSHNHSCNNMAKQWCLHSGRYFNVWAWPARRAGQVRRLKILPLSKHHCLAILLQLGLWLLIVCQWCWIFLLVLGNFDERPAPICLAACWLAGWLAGWQLVCSGVGRSLQEEVICFLHIHEAGLLLGLLDLRDPRRIALCPTHA